mgnify:CR=1 FL=1
MSFSKKLARFALSGALAMSMVLPNSLAVFQAKVNADSLYLRQSPGGAVITTLSKGTTVAVLNNSSSWYKVSVNGKEGYVSGEYLTGTTATAVALGTGTVKCSSSVNFRSAPNTSSTSYGELKNGTAVTVLSTSNGWSKVSYAGKAGYISADYLVTASSGTAISPSNTAASVSISAKRQSVLNYAAQFLGVPYVYGGSTPSGFDCSGFTSYVFKNTVGSIPRVAQAQYDATTRVSRDDLLPGDLVFFGSSTSSISHVGIYVGSNQFIHAPSTGDVVKYSSLTGSYATRYQGAGRVIFE